MTAAGTHLSYDAITAIHWTHRVGAVVTFLYVGGFALVLARTTGFGRYGAGLLAVLLAQVGLGVANVLAGLPLAVAAAHNAGAAILLVTMVVINFALRQKPAP
jgi:cytochrome c oxidase assembly protein subunit 15